MAKILILSLFESNSISQRFGINQAGGGIGFGYDMNFWFSIGLARVKAKTLPKIGSRSRISSR
jgi:hypothetical protein